MDFQPINPNVVPLFQGLKPFLGVRGQVLADGMSSLVNLLASNPGQEAVNAVSKIFSTPGKKDRIITVQTAAGPISLSLSMAAVMFLILILLILSGNLLALSTGTFGDYSDDVIISSDDSASV